jgi:DNA-directed RNA polymerase
MRTYDKDSTQLQAQAEKKMMETGASKFLQNQETLIDIDGGNTAVGHGIIMQCIEPVANALSGHIIATSLGNAKIFAQALRGLVQILDKKGNIDVERIATASIAAMVDAAMGEKQTKVRAVNLIGKALEDEARWTMLDTELKQWTAWKMDGYKSMHKQYSNIRTGMIYSMNKFAENAEKGVFVPWSEDTREIVGLLMYNLVHDNTGIFEEIMTRHGNKTKSALAFTEETKQYVEEFNTSLASTICQYRPMFTEPVDWTEYANGGYQTIRLPFVKNDTYTDSDSIDFEEQMNTVNKLQKTAWTIDQKMFDLFTILSVAGLDVKSPTGKTLWYTSSQLEAPMRPSVLNNEHLKDTEEFKIALSVYKDARKDIIETNIKRGSKFRVQHEALRIAYEFSEFDEIFFPYQVDFRGRIYPIPGTLNPQAADSVRPLIKFANSKVLTNDGAWWLAIQIAGYYGYDSVSLDDRAKWVIDNYETIIMPSGAHPADCIDVWSQADKPFHFIQSCIAYVEARKAWSKGEDYLCDVPVQVDGKCNGLQHFSMMTLDSDVAPYVGLIDTALPGDIYTKVADTAYALVCSDADLGNEYAIIWAEYGIKRKIAKRPTMTCVYGSGRYGYAKQIEGELKEMEVEGRPKGDIIALSNYLAGVMVKALELSIGGATEVMSFLQECAKVYSQYQASIDKNTPLTWVTPAGFAVSQQYLKRKQKLVSMRLGTKKFQIKSSRSDSKMDSMKMGNAIAPNFVHSIDAAHLVRSVDIAAENGIEDFSMIHDSFGCHASDVDVLVASLKEAAIQIHSVDMLQEFRDNISSTMPANWVDKLPPVPVKGTLVLEDLRASDFFFS